jgi:thiol-disulfide isomerase/thioredoxin
MKSVIVILGLIVLMLAGLSLVIRWQNAATQTAENLSSADAPLAQALAAVVAKSPVAPRGPLAPEIVGETWLNSPALAPSDLRDKVVLVEFWTFDCINCQNALPHIRALYQKYQNQGLMVIGVHSPELAFERELGNVKSAIQTQNIPYPIVIDNDFKIWNSFKVMAWPTWYVLDKQGAIRYSHVGEGAYDETDRTIAALLKEKS